MTLEGRKEALEGFLARASGATVVRVVEARPLVGGAIQENWYLGAEFEGPRGQGGQELVLRTDARSRVSVSHGREHEFALLRAAYEAGVRVPEPLWLCRDPAVLGKPFYLMRYVPGTAAGHVIVKETSLGGDRLALAERLGEELARIHAIHPPRPDLDFLEVPESSPALDAVARYRTYLTGHGHPYPALEWGLRWCELNAPATDGLVLTHQDFRTGNYLVDQGGLTAILDWEFCAWGDPMSDIGWFCAKCWRFGRDDMEAGGIGPRAPFYRGYERVSGRAIDEVAVAYWEVMAHLRWAVIALQQGARHLSGEEPSLELALTGRRVAELEFEVLQLTAPDRWSAA